MPYMLQPKSYTQIARPNLYNVAYRRVGAYKGMGRLHPANYLQIGLRPNQIGATTGQYNTLSGQLSLLPPSLRGLGQLPACSSITMPAGFVGPINCDPSQGPVNYTPDVSNLPAVSSPWATTTGQILLQPGGANLVPYLGTTGIASTMPTWLPWVAGGLLVLLLAGGRR